MQKPFVFVGQNGDACFCVMIALENDFGSFPSRFWDDFLSKMVEVLQVIAALETLPASNSSVFFYLFLVIAVVCFWFCLFLSGVWM